MPAQSQKRRRGLRVKRKAPKNIHVRIVNGIRNPSIRSLYDSKKSPAENLRDMGLDVDLNKEVRRRNSSSIDLEESKPKECAAFIGTCRLKESCKALLL